jgi:hypothetical protein
LEVENAFFKMKNGFDPSLVEDLARHLCLSVSKEHTIELGLPGLSDILNSNPSIGIFTFLEGEVVRFVCQT